MVNRYSQTPTDILKTAGFEFLDSEMDANAISGLLTSLVQECHKAELSNLGRETIKVEAIKKLKAAKISRSTLLVDSAFKDGELFGSTPGQGTAIDFDEPEPWPQEVDGASLLDEIRVVLRRYVVLPSHADVAIALWVVHTYALSCFEVSPILALFSPEKRCGKTTLLEVLKCLVWRALLAANITGAALFRTIEKYRPTVLIDEGDTFLKDNEDLRGILNSGHRKASSQVIRTVGNDFDLRAFSTWCSKVLAAIGRRLSSAGTIEDRAIRVLMKRKGKDEKVARLRFSNLKVSTREIREMCARWAQDNEEGLPDADPSLPRALNDREADNWRPLIAIADCVGGDWPRLAREAALELSGSPDEKDSAGVQLLADLRDLFEMEGSERLYSSFIVDKLAAMEDRPWPEWRRGKAITTRQLSQLLQPFEIKPGQVWIDGRNLRGYELLAFQDAFSRYLPDSEVLDPLEPSPARDLSPISDPLGGVGPSSYQNGRNPHEQGSLEDLADEKPDADKEKIDDTQKYLF